MEREESTPERRRNHELREVLDDLIDHIRDFVRTRDDLSPSEIEYAQQRLEWLADEAWRVANDASRNS